MFALKFTQQLKYTAIAVQTTDRSYIDWRDPLEHAQCSEVSPSMTTSIAGCFLFAEHLLICPSTSLGTLFFRISVDVSNYLLNMIVYNASSKGVRRLVTVLEDYEEGNVL